MAKHPPASTVLQFTQIKDVFQYCTNLQVTLLHLFLISYFPILAKFQQSVPTRTPLYKVIVAKFSKVHQLKKGAYIKTEFCSSLESDE